MMDYAEPRPFDDAHFVKPEGGIDWVRGVEPMSGGAKSIRIICELATMLQRNEDTERNDYDWRL